MLKHRFNAALFHVSKYLCNEQYQISRYYLEIKKEGLIGGPHLWEPPDEDPHVRWCERSGANHPHLLDLKLHFRYGATMEKGALFKAIPELKVAFTE